MRISTNTIYSQGGGRISDLTVGLNRTQQQLASGRRMLNPSDDPISAARSLVISQSDAINDQYAINRQSAKSSITMSESALSSVTDVLYNVKTLVVQAGSGALSDENRKSIATELQANFDQLLSLANSTDGAGNYLFAGYNNTSVPYVQSVAGVKFTGDQGQRFLQVDSTRQLPVSDTGSEIFGNIRTSTGQFNSFANKSNLGSATIGVTINPAAAIDLTGNSYEVLFDDTGLNFSITNKNTGATVVPSTVYVSPHSLTVDGMDIVLTDGTNPIAAGDKFTIQPANQDIFGTIGDLINALKTPITDAGVQTDYLAALDQANSNVEKSLSKVLDSRAVMGSSLKEIDSLDNSGSAVGLVFKEQLSKLQDLDYAKAITELNQQQVTLQAAQQSFIKTTSLSLFNYIS
jgi:flagellar hook-associated protein 3 FlgL